MSPQAPLLEIRNLSKTFPGMKALDSVSLTIDAGEIVGLVGQNGSGKSTLVKALAGIHAPDPGSEVVLRGDDGGIAQLHFIHQDLGLVDALSTIENLDLSHKLGLHGLMPAPLRAEERHARALIASFGADFDVRRPVAELSAAERTIIAIARALDRWSSPRNVLCLDEPTAALHGDEAGKLFVAIRRLVDRGAGVIFVSHRLDEVVELVDRVAVLRDGRLIADVRRGSFNTDDLVRLITGGIQATKQRARADGNRAPALSARGISGTTVRSLDLELRAGETVGVSGVLGSGREELASILFGAKAGAIRELTVSGRALPGPTPRRAIEAGMAFVPADRHRDGSVMTMSARENITLPWMRPLLTRVGSLSQRAERAEVARWSSVVELRPPNPGLPLQLFSGGNQQKVVLAKWLRNEPAVLLLDEPTQGVDIGAKAGIYELLASAAARGTAVLMCSSDDKELTACCDRVLVMRDGDAVVEFARDELSEEVLVKAALGL